MNTTKLFTAIAFAAILWAGAAQTVWAQAARVSSRWEPNTNNELQGKSIYDDYLGEDANYYYLLVRKIAMLAIEPTYAVEKYNKRSLQPSGSKELKISIFAIYRIGNEIYAKVDENPPAWFKKIKPKYAIYKFDKSKMIFESINSRFAGIEIKDLQLKVSPDSSKVLMLSIKPDKKGDVTQFVLLDKEMNILRKKEITLPFSSNSAPSTLSQLLKGEAVIGKDLPSKSEAKRPKTAQYNVSYAVDNDGNIYAAGRVYEDKEEYEYTILKFSGENFEAKAFPINMNGYLYHLCHLAVGKNNTLSVAGFYSDDVEVTGGFYFALDTVFKKAQKLAFKEIQIDHLKLSHPKADAKKIEKYPEKRYDNFRFDQTLYFENGDIVFCAEEGTGNLKTVDPIQGQPGSFGMGKAGMASGGGMNKSPGVSVESKTTTEHGFFYDIYVFRITPTGLAWMKRVPKNQKSSDTNKRPDAPQNKDQLSYRALLSGDNVVLLFMDNAKNESLSEDHVEKIPLAWGPNIRLMSVTLNKAGVQAKQLVQGLDGLGLNPEVGASAAISNSKLFISARRKKECKVGVISVDK